jgi:hypothetical protein
MLSLVVDKCVEVLASQPDPVLPAANLGAKRPASGADIPAISISLAVEDTRGIGFGRFLRSGDALAQHTAIVDVSATPETFSSDLRRLRIAPLPLKKNPAALQADFAGDDVQIRNVTDLGQPLLYRFTPQPTHKEEYRLDVASAQIVFGGAQTTGEKLEVVHWTVTWRDDIVGDRYRGTLFLELWASSLSQIGPLARRLQQRLQTQLTLLRQKGFVALRPASLDPAEASLYEPPSGSAFTVWRQRLSYRFVFEAEEGGELSSGVPIARIDVEVTQPQESFSVPGSR